MAIFIGHRTVLAYWRTHDRNWAQPHFTGSTTRKQLPLLRPNGYWHPLEIRHRRKACVDFGFLQSKHEKVAKPLSPRIWSGKHPSRSFYKITQDLYISTPEATFLQLGNELSLIQLITVGYELCGSYGLSVQSSNGFLRREPRSNPQLIERYLEKCEGIHGVKATKRASSYLVKRSASPMESLLSMLLCLPPSLGGFGLPRPELNYPIETNEGSVAIRRCDLCWPDQQFALEYDSDTFHSDASKLHLDSSRRSALEKAGVHVVSVTKNQVFDRGQLFNLATIASKRLGKRLSPTPFNFAQKQDEIYQAVFE